MSQPLPTPRSSGGRSGPTGPPPGQYGLLFPALADQGWAPPGASDEERLAYIRERVDRLFEDPSGESSLPASHTILGQFIAHDLTFDARTDLTHTGRAIQNARTPRLDLDCVYGGGPRTSPHLYDVRDPRKLALGCTPNGELDLPRSADAAFDHAGTNDYNRRRAALVGDPRNDDNIMIAQLHLAFLRFHNRLVEEKRFTFEQARQRTCLNYQWLVLHEYLADLCTRYRIDRILEAPDDRLFLRARPAFVPFEFAFAAFRFGHSMVAASYRLNEVEAPRDLYVWDAKDWMRRDNSAHGTLEGHRELPPGWTIQWDQFLRGNGVQRAQEIGPRMVEPLRYLPSLGSVPYARTLAYRTLVRGWQLRLPAGQQVAEHIEEAPLDSPDPGGDPLWIYVLREAEAEGGHRLGPVGARIVAEVFVRLLEDDPNSILNQTAWRPTVHGTGPFSLREFLAFAGAPITRDEWDGSVGGQGA